VHWHTNKNYNKILNKLEKFMKKSVFAVLEPKLSTRLAKTEVTRAIAENMQQVMFDVGDSDVYVANTKQSRDNITVECTDGSIITLTIEVK
jgi:hypothetical protein